MEVLEAIIVALIISVIFYFLLKIKGPWKSFWSFFLVIMLAVWATSIWVTPAGPIFWGVTWVPLFFVGILFAIFMAAFPSSGQQIKGRS